MNTLIRTAALGALLAGSAMAPAAFAQAGASSADAMFQANTLNLSAYGESHLAPDLANINIGVNTTAATAADAMRLNAAKMNQVIAALRRQGVADKDIQTSSVNLNAQYAYEQNQPPRLTGYQAANQVTIRVLDLTKLGQAIDATVGAGANQINGVSFGLQNPQAAEDEARRQAVQALQAKAALYAAATNQRIARLVNLSEGGGYSPQPPMPMPMVRAMAKSESTPVAAGELTVRIDITGLYQVFPIGR